MYYETVKRLRVSVKGQLTLSTPSEINQKPTNEEIFGKPRLNTACRNQCIASFNTLDDILPKDHLARLVWEYVQSLDLSIILGKILAVKNHAGRPATDPKILLALWLFATIKSIGSSRLIEEYCQEHDAFKWICGGVNINYHTISDFRSNNRDQLDALLTMSVAALANAEIITLEKISQDGMRVRASAGTSSFRREPTIEMQYELAKALVEDIKEEEKKRPGACKKRLAAAELHAAEDRLNRLAQAKSELEKIRNEKIAYAKKEYKKIDSKELEKIRVSMTDPEARIMKMACSGYRPAYNVQFASTNKGKAIIAVDVSNKGADNNLLGSMLDKVVQTYKVIPQKWFVDGGYDSHDELNKVEAKYETCKVYMPVKITSKNQNNPYLKQPKDSKIVGEWRERMGTVEAKELYRERGATAEFVNAAARNRGFQQFNVRGIEKAKCVALIFALTHNMVLQIGCGGFDLLQLIGS
jgi:transposase